MEDKVSDCWTISAAPFVLYQFEIIVIFCCTAPPQSIVLGRRIWRTNSSFFLVGIHVRISPLLFRFLVVVASGSRQISPLFFLRAAEVVVVSFGKIFCCCGAFLPHEPRLQTRRDTAICSLSRVAKLLTATQAIRGTCVPPF